MEKNLEIAKSFFILAQLLIILAGFLFASSGIAYSSTFNSFDKAVSLKFANTNNTNLTQEVIQIYGDLTMINLSFYKFLFTMGIIATFLSLTAWGIGNSKIHKRE